MILSSLSRLWLSWSIPSSVPLWTVSTSGCCLPWMFPALILLGGATQESAVEAEAPTPVSWVFLDSGTPRTNRPREEMAELQAAHLANLTRLAEEGKNLAAGPLDGNSRKTRGIVVLTVPVGESLDAEFAGDPYVKEGHLVVRSYAMKLLHGKVHPPKEPFEMGDYVISMVRCDAAVEAHARAELFAELVTDLVADEAAPLSLAVAFPGSTDEWCGVLMFTSPHAVRMQKLVAAHDTVQSGELQAESYVQYLGRGILDPEPPSAPAPQKSGSPR